jgi:MFS family permease
MPPAAHPLSIANFRYYWVARLSATLAQSAMMLIIGWQVYDIARSSGMSMSAAAAQLGLIGLIQFIPLFALTPITGWTADRLDRRHIARATLSLQIVGAALLAWATWSGTNSLLILFTVAFLVGIARAFSGPALGALAPNLVPREILPKAIALSSISWQAGMVAGPWLGGYLYEWRPEASYLGATILFCVSLLCLFLIGPVPRPAVERGRHPVRQMIDGLSYVRTNRLVLAAITLDLFAVFLAGATALLPIYARDILQVGAEGLAQLAAAPALGATITALFFSFRPLKTGVGMKMLVSVIVFGAATIKSSACRHWMPAVAASRFFVVGRPTCVSVCVRQSLDPASHARTRCAGRWVRGVGSSPFRPAERAWRGGSGLPCRPLIGPSCRRWSRAAFGAIAVTPACGRSGFPNCGLAAQLRTRPT